MSIVSEVELAPHRTDSSRLTIGLFISSLEITYARIFWSGVDDALRDSDANLILFPGKPLGSPSEMERQYNVIYQLADERNCNALIFSSTMFPHFDVHQVQQYVSQFSQLPIVIAGNHIQGFPSVLVDNKTGVRQSISHLIEVHGYTKIAYVRGPLGGQEADKRLETYIETMRDYDIPIRAELIETGDFTTMSGEAAMKRLLRNNDAGIDAVVFANDEMVNGAANILNDRGLRVPEDIAVVGFDNLPMSKINLDVSLTSVQQPIYELGHLAAQLAVGATKGDSDLTAITLPTELVVGASCGCALTTHKKRRDSCVILSKLQLHDVTPERQRFENKIVNEIKFFNDSQRESEIRFQVGEILDYIDQYSDQDVVTEDYLHVLNRFFNQAVNKGDLITVWQNTLTNLNDYLYHRRKKNQNYRSLAMVFQKTRILLGEVVQAKEGNESLVAYVNVLRINRSLENIMSQLDTNSLKKTIYTELHELNIHRCHISLYEDSPCTLDLNQEWRIPQGLQTVLAHDHQWGCLRVKSTHIYDRRWIYPADVFSFEDRFSAVVLPLFSNNRHYGIVVFDLNEHNSTNYESLAMQIGNTIRTCDILAEERQQRTTLEAKTQEQERAFKEQKSTQKQLVIANREAEKANVLKSKYLANLSHKFRTPLNAIQNIADLIKYEAYSKTEEVIHHLGIITEELSGLDQKDNAGIEALIETVSLLISCLGGQTNARDPLLGKIEQLLDRMNPGLSNIMYGHIFQIKENLDKERAEFQSGLLQIRTSNEHLLNLVSMALSIKNIIKDSIDINIQRVDVKSFVDSIITNGQAYLESLGKSGRISIFLDADIDGDVSAYFDESKIKQVLLNLVSNAIKFTESGSVRLSVRASATHFRFSVTDTGMGIRSSDQSRIFTEYGRVNQSQNIEGTGLGLAISKRLVKLHGGEMGFESSYKEGSCFWFDIPISRESLRELAQP